MPSRPDYQKVRDQVFPGATWRRKEYGDAGWIDLLEMEQLEICFFSFLQNKLPGRRGIPGTIHVCWFGIQPRTGNSKHLLWERRSINLSEFKDHLEELKRLLLGFAAAFMSFAGVTDGTVPLAVDPLQLPPTAQEFFDDVDLKEEIFEDLDVSDVFR